MKLENPPHLLAPLIPIILRSPLVEEGAGMQNPRPRPIWLGHCLLSRPELDHGAFQLPGALQMRESAKHDNQRKLGRWSPREGRTGASTEHVQTLWSRRPPRQASQALLPACLSHLDGGCLLRSAPLGRARALPCTSQAQRQSGASP